MYLAFKIQGGPNSFRQLEMSLGFKQEQVREDCTFSGYQMHIHMHTQILLFVFFFFFFNLKLLPKKPAKSNTELNNCWVRGII